MTTVKRALKTLFFVALVAAVTGSYSPVQAQRFDQSGLLTAMEQRTEYGAPLRALKRDGYLATRPRIRTNYDDFYFPTRSFSVLGGKVVVVQENYLGRYVGCCADPGIGLYFEGSSKASFIAVEDFAIANKCIYLEGNDMVTQELPTNFMRLKPRKSYALLRCSDGDKNRIPMPVTSRR
jgi:hypothetical protein